ncbi:MAG: 1-deoxy-D-xylulose-5-phosphate reductoisomerase [Planctomycetota bacterium]|nr:1-deoxy-D-xylulose-5-phosphate reductoisomerase [Planctomycetota bacterium]
MPLRRVLILGATGSIGKSALDIIRQHPDRLAVAGLAAKSNVAELAKAVREFSPPWVAIAEPEAEDNLRQHLDGFRGKIVSGVEGICECARSCGADICLSAIVGSAGLEPTLAAITAGQDIALANKEILVAGGEIILQALAATGKRLLPVDSEHWAIFQCLQNSGAAQVRRIILTASGGPFRGKSAAEIDNASRAAALNHPVWKMGDKITIDSATLANKALEVIEAHWLFGLPYDKIDVLVHPQSVVHGLVEFEDGTVLAQMSVPDMRIPIQAALSWPERWPAPAPRLDLARLSSLDFEPPDPTAFPLFALGLEAGRRGGTAPCLFSAANEEAVQMFLDADISFADISRAVRASLANIPISDATDIASLRQTEALARAYVRSRKWLT